MKQIILTGHSGCKVYLIDPDGKETFVRKVSKSVQYNERLSRQCAKQKNYKSTVANIPQVLDEGLLDGLYYFDMEYVRGTSVSALLGTCTVDKVDDICRFLNDFINENVSVATLGVDVGYIIEGKLRDISQDLQLLRNDKIIKEALEVASNHEWSVIPTSPCHGDLTFENILYSYDGSFYLIDFHDTFHDTWIADVSKILQDLLVGWSFRHQLINADAASQNIKIRALLLRKQFTDAMSSLIVTNKKSWEDIYIYLLLDLLRIVPYIKDKKTFEFVNNSIKSLVNNIKDGGLHEYINCPVRWPFYEISRS